MDDKRYCVKFGTQGDFVVWDCKDYKVVYRTPSRSTAVHKAKCLNTAYDNRRKEPT